MTYNIKPSIIYGEYYLKIKELMENKAVVFVDFRPPKSGEKFITLIESEVLTAPYNFEVLTAPYNFPDVSPRIIVKDREEKVYWWE
jgi:hypothetical protein